MSKNETTDEARGDAGDVMQSLNCFTDATSHRNHVGVADGPRYRENHADIEAIEAYADQRVKAAPARGVARTYASIINAALQGAEERLGIAEACGGGTSGCLTQIDVLRNLLTALGLRPLDDDLDMPDGWTRSWCPACGPDVAVDEEGLCLTCGCTAVGDGVEAIAIHAESVADQRVKAEREVVINALTEGQHSLWTKGFEDGVKHSSALRRALDEGKAEGGVK